MRGVDPLDVERGIRLRVAEPLRLVEDVGKRGAAFAHLGQDEVARAVDDPGEPLDPVPGEPFAQRLDDRDPARHRGFERHHHPARMCGLEDRVAVHRDERLVCGDHMLAALDGLEDEPASGGPAPPMSSTTTSMSGSRTISSGSVVREIPSVEQMRSLSSDRAAARVTTMSRPARRVISLPLRLSTLTVPAADRSEAEHFRSEPGSIRRISVSRAIRDDRASAHRGCRCGCRS